MIKKAMEYVQELSRPQVFDFNGKKYADKPLSRIDREPKARVITLTTLSSLIEYIKSGWDFDRNYIIHVQSPDRVLVMSTLDIEREREIIVEVQAHLPSFAYGSYMDHEAFCIALQSKFVDEADRALLLKFAGTVEDGSVAEYGDDGVSQKATVKTGIASKSDVLVPSPVHLAPFRTFVEVGQPVSAFIFRMQNKAGVQCALFEADGGAWKLEAMARVKDYLRAELKEYKNFIVIS